MSESMLALVGSTRVWSVVPDTDPSSLQMPWWIDEARVLRNAVTAEVVELRSAGGVMRLAVRLTNTGASPANASRQKLSQLICAQLFAALGPWMLGKPARAANASA